MSVLAYAQGRPIEMTWQVSTTVAPVPSVDRLLDDPVLRADMLRRIQAKEMAQGASAPETGMPE